MGVAQTGQDVVGLWAAEASCLVAQSPEVVKGGKRGQVMLVGSTLHKGWVYPPDVRGPHTCNPGTYHGLRLRAASLFRTPKLQSCPDEGKGGCR